MASPPMTNKLQPTPPRKRLAPSAKLRPKAATRKMRIAPLSTKTPSLTKPLPKRSVSTIASQKILMPLLQSPARKKVPKQPAPIQ